MMQGCVIHAPIVVNLSSRFLASDQCAEIECRKYIEEEINVSAHCQPTDAVAYTQALFERIGLTIEERNTKSIILALSGFAPLAAHVLAHAHGIKGGFPKALWLSPHPSDQTKYVVGDIVNLQAIRDSAGESRAGHA